MTLFLFSAQDSGGSAWLRAHSGVLRCFPCSRCDQWKRSFCLGKRRQWYSKQTSFIFFFLVFACVVYDSCISTQSLMVGSLSERSPRARHPGHPQLSAASVFTWQLWSPEGGVWSWLLHDYQQPAQHCGMWKQQVTILVLDSKVWQKWGSDERRYITLRRHFHSMFSVENANILSLYKLDYVGWWW